MKIAKITQINPQDFLSKNVRWLCLTTANKHCTFSPEGGPENIFHEGDSKSIFTIM